MMDQSPATYPSKASRTSLTKASRLYLTTRQDPARRKHHELQKAKQYETEKLDFYRESKFISLSIDEGTTFKTAYLNLILHDVVNRKNQYFAESVVMSGKKQIITS